jgi:hypothetical protein
MIEKYYPREQPDDLRRREPGIGAGAIQQTKTEWSQLIAMLELAQRWQELMGEFTTGARSNEISQTTTRLTRRRHVRSPDRS